MTDTRAYTFANRLSDSGVEVTNIDTHKDSSTVQFSIIPNPIEDIYYKSVVQISQEGYIERYEIRLPHLELDEWTEEDARIHYKQLLGVVETDEVSDWNVNMSRTHGIIAAHVESVYSKEDAPTFDEMLSYIQNIHSLFN